MEDKQSVYWVLVDPFTVSLHNPNGRHLPTVRAVQGLKGTVNGLWKTVEIPTGHMSLQGDASEAIPAYI